MRSIGFTLILFLVALVASGLAGWRLTGRGFERFLGAPVTPVGGLLFTSFKAEDVKFIEVSQSGASADFSLGPNGWQAEKPWDDRMDPRAAGAIIGFTLGMKVRDYAKPDEVDLEKAGLADNGTNIRLLDSNRNRLAKYRIGRRTSWMAPAETEDGKPVPTVFIRVRERERENQVYSCSGDIAPLFKHGLKFLRDHRPFYFNPLALQKIRVRSTEGEFLLGRENAKSPWRVVKPLDLATDVEAVKSLISGLYDLQALKITDRATLTVPTMALSPNSTEIAISSFGSEAEIRMEVLPPETADSRSALATVSDRPETVFELPLKAEQGIVSLANLTLALNDLRDSTLTNLNIQSLRAISIQPSTGKEILISRTPPKPWIATIEGKSSEANEERLFALLKAVTEAKATGFESDAATDFTPWGLERPFLKVRFLGADNQALELAFGIDSKGAYFANRIGTPTVVKVDQALISSIAVRPYEWRLSRLWSVDRNQLFALTVAKNAQEPLILKYSSLDDSWTARQAEKDITGELDPNRANYVLGLLEGLKVSRWLAPDDDGANNALTAPVMTFTIVERATDDFGDSTGEIITRSVRIAPNVQTENPGFYYGRVDSDPNPFLLDVETFNKLATDLTDRR
jgi:hypothetical protein